MKYAAMFVWVVVPIAAYTVFAMQGLPHVIWSYSFTGGERYDLFSDRYYTSCTFIGPYGGFTGPAENGGCPWIRFFRPEADQ